MPAYFVTYLRHGIHLEYELFLDLADPTMPTYAPTVPELLELDCDMVKCSR